jgi:colanic acid/amylovoran biosynthesis protein
VHDADRQDRRKLDKHVIKAIQDKLGDPCKERLVTIVDEIMPSEARLILGNGVFTITARMHSAISTFQMLKPAIALSYSPKYKGVIGDELDRNDLVIESGGQDLWRTGLIAKALEAKILYTLDNYDTLVDAIKARMPDVKTKALSQILHMVKVLDEHNPSDH